MPGRLRRVLVAAVAIVVAGAAAAPITAGAATVRAEWAGTACGELTRIPIPVALDLSDDGLVVGRDHRPRAVSWDRRTGAIRWYGGIEGGLPSELTAVSPGGAVAGIASLAGPAYAVPRAVRVDGPLPLQPVSRSPARYDDVNDVNDANTVVGTSQITTGPGSAEAFRWRDRREVLAPPPGYRYLQALAVNGSGWVVGRGSGPDGTGTVATRSLRWSPAGVVTVMPPLGDGAELLPVHIADDGRITGYRLTAGRGDAIVTWTPAGGYTVVPAPTPNGTPVDLQLSGATADGTVLGAVFDPQADPPLRPFQHHPATGFRLMVEAGSRRPLPSVPQALNARHEAIVAIEGRPHLWAPCPGTEYPGEMLSSTLRN